MPLYEPIGVNGSLFGEFVRAGDWDVKVQDWTPIPRPQLLPSKNEQILPQKVTSTAPQGRAFTILHPVAMQPEVTEHSPIIDPPHGILHTDPKSLHTSSYKYALFCSFKYIPIIIKLYFAFLIFTEYNLVRERIRSPLFQLLLK